MMTEIEQKMRDLAKSLLQDGKVNEILGYEQGDLPLKTKPVFINKAEEVSRLVWNEFCGLNLVSFIPKVDKPKNNDAEPAKKIGVIMKHYDIKTYVVLIEEKQITRENVVIIAMPCIELINTHKIEVILEGEEITGAEITDDEIIVKGNNFEKTFNKNELRFNSCEFIGNSKPPIYDHIIEDPDAKPVSEAADEFLDVIEFEKKTPKERWEYFKKEFERCTRCHACKEACPLCYCKECFVDLNQPQWVGKTTNISDNLLYHINRAIHLAGRCVGCDACSRACPEGINLQLIYKRIRLTALKRWNFKAGEDPEAIGPMGTYSLDDPQEFIVEED